MSTNPATKAYGKRVAKIAQALRHHDRLSLRGPDPVGALIDIGHRADPGATRQMMLDALGAAANDARFFTGIFQTEMRRSREEVERLEEAAARYRRGGLEVHAGGRAP